MPGALAKAVPASVSDASKVDRISLFMVSFTPLILNEYYGNLL
jgi:hypothetical protein